MRKRTRTGTGSRWLGENMDKGGDGGGGGGGGGCDRFAEKKRNKGQDETMRRERACSTSGGSRGDENENTVDR